MRIVIPKNILGRLVTMNRLPVRYCLLLILLPFPVFSLAQLTAPGVSAERFTSYPGTKDKVFIFCNATGTQKGSLTASSPGGTAPFDFTWHEWSDVTGDFTVFMKTDDGVTGSSVTNLGEGGYKVRITDGTGFDTTFIGWIHLDSPYADARLQNFTCDYVALNGTAAIDTFYYRNPSTGNPVKLPNAIRFMWSSTPSSAIPYPSIEIDPVTFSPPLEDVVYKLQVTDSFLCVSETSFPYSSIHVKADFTVDPNKGEAPLEVNFTDNSIRKTYYQWEFGDTSKTQELVKPIPPVSHIYYRPGEYSVKLTVTSEQGCIDSLRYEYIVVDPSDLEIPNVFTPDGDGINDFFIVESTSLRTINVEIYSRSGILVYSFQGEGERLTGWEGWDGTVNNSSIKAAPGVYFYIIRARGWDDIIFDGKEYRGFFYLYR